MHMLNRYLLVGDSFWGAPTGSADILADLLLVDFPEIPLSFSIHCSSRNSLDALFRNCPRDIIGRQAGFTVLCIGWEDMHGTMDAATIIQQAQQLLHEILHNSPSHIIITTIPTIQHTAESIQRSKIQAYNEFLRSSHKPERMVVVDLDHIFTRYQELQISRGELVRNLFTDHGTLGVLGQMLCARTLSQELLRSDRRFLGELGLTLP